MLEPQASRLGKALVFLIENLILDLILLELFLVPGGFVSGTAGAAAERQNPELEP